LIKKIIVFTLLIKKAINENDLFRYLKDTYWFKETVDFCFYCEYEMRYNKIMNTFFKRGVVKRENGNLFATVKP